MPAFFSAFPEKIPVARKEKTLCRLTAAGPLPIPEFAEAITSAVLTGFPIKPQKALCCEELFLIFGVWSRKGPDMKTR